MDVLRSVVDRAYVMVSFAVVPPHEAKTDVPGTGTWISLM